MPKLARLAAVGVPLLSLCQVVSAPRDARGALHEFTLQGEVTQASFWPNVAVGDAFTIKYTADSVDQDANSLLGRYAASDAVVTLPHTSITSFGIASVRVLTVTPGPWESVSFVSASPNYQFTIDFELPIGTLGGDGLPLLLPLAPPATTEWRVYDFGPQVRGAITSYTSVPVPEPVTASAGIGMAVTLASGWVRRQRRRRHRASGASANSASVAGSGMLVNGIVSGADSV